MAHVSFIIQIINYYLLQLNKIKIIFIKIINNKCVNNI
jgi:hypothetical protein